MAGLGTFTILLAACFGTNLDNTDTSSTGKLLMGKTWLFQGVTYDLGSVQGDNVVYGNGSLQVFGGDTMLVLSDSTSYNGSGSAKQLFTNSRECSYAVKWASPGACAADDFWKFQSDSILSLHSGTAHCEAGEPAVTTGKWSLVTDSQVNMTAEGKTTAFQIEKLGKTGLQLSETQQDTICGGTIEIKTVYSFSSQ
ncbi:MAG TPA: hypothetical protein DCQ83_02255 [Fibrobacteres bacterium]|jgi:hypothetical protein|nr:hypothetical protein [Fibrobacterota bacterium]